MNGEPQQIKDIESEQSRDYIVYRIDDNGNVFVVKKEMRQEDAEHLVAEFEARGHKQMYWAEAESTKS